MKNNENVGCQAVIVNIKYGRNLRNYRDRPNISVLDIPDSIVKISDTVKKNDSIETFVYNTLTKKYGTEVNFCQIFLP